ncbi:hypothetical protein AC578_4710 [Pseudocercospora eumusae]|uniref:Uncharacterized protein n=1 Tax=Pseudocercospora eumusae TaxID=321146 RepID=A0A139GZ59_9PEZI|nr:hypothetical protein AC578_4710 [Pseudocercospora eumusae]
MSRASATPEKSCLKGPRSAPSPGSTESNRPTMKRVTFEVRTEISISHDGQGMQNNKKPGLLPPISRPEEESEQIKLARKRTALCQKLLPVRKRMLKWSKTRTEDAEDMDAEHLAGMCLSATSRADNEEDAALLKDAVGKMYRDIILRNSESQVPDAAERSEAIPDNNETAQDIAQLNTIETTSEAKQSSTQATATNNEGTDLEANNTAEHAQVKVADRRVCRTRNKKNWIIDSRATVKCQLNLQHATSVAEWRKIRTLHKVLCVRSLAATLLSVDMLPVAYGVRSLLTLPGSGQMVTTPSMPLKEISIAKTYNAVDYGPQKGEDQRDTPSEETQQKHHILVFHHGQPVGILIFKSL